MKENNGTRMNADERGFKIRKAGKRDLKDAAKIFREESAKTPYSTRFSPASALKDISELFKNDFYVVIDKDKMIGFVASHIILSDNKKAYVDELWIKPKWQGKGAGKMLMNFIEDMYNKKGISSIGLVTRRKASAVGFYKKLKYKESRESVSMYKKL